AARALLFWRGGDRMVRAAPARADSSVHARPAAQRDRAGHRGGLLALPLQVAAGRDGFSCRRPRGAGRRSRSARRLRVGGWGVGMFFGDVVNATGLLRTEVEKGLAELVAWGLVSSDSFAGLRALLVPSDRRRPLGGGYRRRGRIAPFGVETAGRWARTHARPPIPDEQIAEAIAWQLLRRYGVVFRRLVQRETLLAPWRDILRVYRRLEARGEIR